MFRASFSILIPVWISLNLHAQTPKKADDAIYVGPGVTNPRLLHKVEPEYSSTARADHVQGTVVLQLVVDENGRPTDITVISPLGFGLDERAVEAVEKWKFAPGIKDGKPVRIWATVETQFRFPEIWFDEKTERQRTAFNLNLQTLRQRHNGEMIDKAVKSMQDLSRQHFAPAMYVIGIWKINGENLAKDPAEGLSLIQAAAAKNYGPALHAVAIRKIRGVDLPLDAENGMEMMKRAAILGSPQAQFYLGDKYESGKGVPKEADRARRYFRLCAAQGMALCQVRLGKLLLDEENRPERDYVQAIVWLQLAGEQGNEQAKEIALRESASLTPAQTGWMTNLKAQLVRK